MWYIFTILDDVGVEYTIETHSLIKCIKGTFIGAKNVWYPSNLQWKWFSLPENSFLIWDYTHNRLRNEVSLKDSNYRPFSP